MMSNWEDKVKEWEDQVNAQYAENQKKVEDIIGCDCPKDIMNNLDSLLFWKHPSMKGTLNALSKALNKNIVTGVDLYKDSIHRLPSELKTIKITFKDGKTFTFNGIEGAPLLLNIIKDFKAKIKDLENAQSKLPGKKGGATRKAYTQMKYTSAANIYLFLDDKSDYSKYKKIFEIFKTLDIPIPDNPVNKNNPNSYISWPDDKPTIKYFVNEGLKLLGS